MELNPSEFKIDTWRSSPHSNWIHKPDNAIRITHIPTGIFAESENERSIYKNRNCAIEELKHKLQNL